MAKKPPKTPLPEAPSDPVPFAAALDSKRAVEDRVAALMSHPFAVNENEADLQALLKVLRDRSEPIEVRLAALQTLQTASFSVVDFASRRPDYVAALREVAEDPDSEMRQRALGLLSRMKDGFAQQKLLEGLEQPDKALVPPEKALQLLGNDPHAGAFKIARAIVRKPPNPTAKREALRLLSADVKAIPLFEQILRDKDEAPEYREISASALQASQPEKFQEHAREIVMDATEKHDIQTTCLTALTHFGDGEALKDDQALLERVDELKGVRSGQVKQSARAFLNKYDAR